MIVAQAQKSPRGLATFLIAEGPVPRLNGSGDATVATKGGQIVGKTARILGIGTLVSLVSVTTATADYETHPELRPEVRCVDAQGLRFDPASVGPDGKTPSGLDPIHCQRLFWDLPATTEVGAVRVGAPFDEDPVPRFPRGVTDRLPPLYVDANGNGYERPGEGRTPLCSGVDEVPWWEPIVDAEGNPETGTDELGYHDADDPSQPQSGPLFRVACRRGTRAYYGPWQIGRDDTAFDALSREQFVRFENTDRLDRDVAAGMADADERFEWSMGSEFYNHFASHHGTCYFPNDATCNAPGPREKFQPGGECWEGYQDQAEPDGRCYAADADQGRGSSSDSSESCSGVAGNGAYRNATQIPGRLAVAWGESRNRGIREVDDQIWRCNHHVVHQLPPGSYDMDRLADFRQQTGGLANPRVRGVDCETEDDPATSIDESRGCTIFGVDAGDVFGGAVGEMIIQNFTEAALSGVEPLNLMFNAIVDAATTYYPPFTWQYHTSVWYPPFDAAVVVGAIHSHHRMVKGTMDVVPSNPPRLQSVNPQCGGWASGEPPDALYVNWEWEDAIVCDWGGEPDGPVVVRKNQGISTTCFVNNGVTPEAIKHGLVAGDLVESLKVLGAPIPEYPETVPASTWGDPLAQSPVGTDLLYGTHPPINYRVVYKCATDGMGSAKASTLVTNKPVCSPNPAVDADGDYIDGPYVNEDQCGSGGICEPGSITFACVGEDEMCIGVAAYYALPRLGSESGHDEAMEELGQGNLDGVGTPGNTGVQMDLPSGDCPECDEGPAL